MAAQPRILLLGKDGQVGRELQRSLAPMGALVAVGRAGLVGMPADFTRPQELAELVRRLTPDIIVNAAAYTAVDRAESEPALAHAVNEHAVAVLADQALRLGAWLLHFSTDYVFDGSGDAPWHEDGRVAPLGTYGRSKAAGELAVRESGCRHLVLRTSWVHSAHGNNFVVRLLEQAATGRPVPVVADQVGAPTAAPWLSDVAAGLLSGLGSRVDHGGIWHVAAAGAASRYEVALEVVASARKRGAALPPAEECIAGVDSCSLATAAPRPANSRLDISRLARHLGAPVPAWQDGIHDTVQRLAAQRQWRP